MIKEAWGEDALDFEVSKKGTYREVGDDQEPTPRIRRPWHVLVCVRLLSLRRKLNVGEEEKKLGLGVRDEGQEQGHHEPGIG